MFKSNVTGKTYYSEEAMKADEAAKKAFDAEANVRKEKENAEKNTAKDGIRAISESINRAEAAFNDVREANRKLKQEEEEKINSILKEADLEIKEIRESYKKAVEDTESAAAKELDELRKKRINALVDYNKKYGPYIDVSTSGTENLSGDFSSFLKEFFKF